MSINPRYQYTDEDFRQLADSMPQIVWIAEGHGDIFYINRKWYEFTGYPEVPLKGNEWLEPIHEMHRTECLKAWKHCLETGSSYEFEYLVRNRNGQYEWFLGRAVPVKDNVGRTLRWFGTCTNIDEQKKQEKDLESTIRTRDEFLSFASHELKTPITALKLQLEMARMRAGSESICGERIIKALDSAVKQVNRLTDLIEDLLDITRIQAGQLRFNFERINISDLVEDIVERFSKQFEMVGSTVSKDLEPNVFGHLDSVRMEQVLMNLLTNSLKYAPGTPVQIFLKKYGESLCLAVEDKGPGIDKGKHEKIFNRFVRGVEKIDTGGLGLGLFISKRIVEAHHGSIRVDSEPGRGATFTVELPLFDNSLGARTFQVAGH